VRALFALPLLAACAQAPVPDNSASVSVASVGSLGRFKTVVYVDDRVSEQRFDQDGQVRQTERVIPGAYVRALGAVLANGPEAQAKASGGIEVCLDYGADMVRLDPPRPEFDMLRDDCPDPAITALMAQVLDAVAR
jgi:hypothetical protein